MAYGLWVSSSQTYTAQGQTPTGDMATSDLFVTHRAVSGITGQQPLITLVSPLCAQPCWGAPTTGPQHVSQGPSGHTPANAHNCCSQVELQRKAAQSTAAAAHVYIGMQLLPICPCLLVSSGQPTRAYKAQLALQSDSTRATTHTWGVRPLPPARPPNAPLHTATPAVRNPTNQSYMCGTRPCRCTPAPAAPRKDSGCGCGRPPIRAPPITRQSQSASTGWSPGT